MWTDPKEISGWAYYHCRDVEDDPEIRSLITDPYWAYRYCKDVKDIPEIKKYITESYWSYRYCIEVKDRPEVRKYITRGKFMPDLIDDVIEFWEKIISNDEVTVKFTKKDGSIRIMKCTLNFDKIPKEDHPKNVSIPQILKLVKNSKIVHVYDLEAHGWRSIPFERVEWLDTPDVRYIIKKGGNK